MRMSDAYTFHWCICLMHMPFSLCLSNSALIQNQVFLSLNCLFFHFCLGWSSCIVIYHFCGDLCFLLLLTYIFKKIFLGVGWGGRENIYTVHVLVLLGVYIILVSPMLVSKDWDESTELHCRFAILRKAMWKLFCTSCRASVYREVPGKFPMEILLSKSSSSSSAFLSH